MNLWETLGVSGLLIGALTFIAKLIIDKTASLQYDKLKLEHQLKFSKIYEERYQAIKEIYNLLIDVKLHVELKDESGVISDKLTKEEHATKFLKFVLELGKKTMTNKIYFKNNELPNRILELTGEYLETYQNDILNEKDMNLKSKDEIEKLTNELEEEFRSLLH